MHAMRHNNVDSLVEFFHKPAHTRIFLRRIGIKDGSVAEWLVSVLDSGAEGLGSNRSRDAVG